MVFLIFFIIETSVFFEVPIRGSPSSKALYLAKNNNKGYLLQYLPPYSHTSEHYHQKKTETFLNLEGRVRVIYRHVNSNLEIKQILSQSSLTLQPYHWHRSMTDESPAVTLLHIEPPDLSWDDHVYSE